MLNLSGEWHVKLNGTKQYTKSEGTITLPGILQTQGYGEIITKETEFMSGLHNPFWYDREEYKYAQEDGTKVPFLAQPCLVYSGEAEYEKEFTVTESSELVLNLELTRWKVSVFLDDAFKGELVSLFAPFEFDLGYVPAGTHRLKICVDNSLQYPYRPDGHGVSDALGATWNGIGGEICLLTKNEVLARENAKREYAKSNPRSVEVKDGKFFIDGKAKYFRGTHFGGDYPHTGMPEQDRSWWDRLMLTVKEWGFNFIRCHSYCPPEIAFAAADDAGVYILVECGMWNDFHEDIPMLDVLKTETERILAAFGHHPSFVMFSSGNEPGGDWYKVLRDWVSLARETDKKLGYEGRRIYTAESGWFYDTEPSKTTGTDFLYFHRSNYGPYPGGAIRNDKGWRGGDYNCSLEGSRLPAICHEMGQWCSYPDFEITKKFSGYMTSSHYDIFKKLAEANGLLEYNKDFISCSGKNQLRMLKEDMEANYRTEHLYGYEYLDLHDYLGQGGAFVGILDAFWDNKGYSKPSEFKEICSDTIVLTRLKSYVYKNDETVVTPIAICHFGDEDMENASLIWKFFDKKNGKIIDRGVINDSFVKAGENTEIGSLKIELNPIKSDSDCTLAVELVNNGDIVSKNHWDITVFAKSEEVAVGETSNFVYTCNLEEALKALTDGKKVLFTPYLSELDFDCPAYNMKNSFWNNQMGPTWVRALGLSVNEKHPALGGFPTEHTGGWQWEDILGRCRMFKLDAKYENIVRGIDEWNRSFPMSLIFEANVLNGKLLMATADLSGSFEERPAAYSLRQSLMKYACSDNFNPEQTIDVEEITKHFMPLNKGNDIMSTIDVHAPSSNGEKIYSIREETDINPNNAVLLENVAFPLYLDIKLNDAVTVSGLCYLPPQGDRDFLGSIKDYKIYSVDNDGKRTEICSGTFKYAYDMQKTDSFEVKTDRVILEVDSVYAQGTSTRWDENEFGWYKKTVEEPECLQISGLQVLFKEDIPYRKDNNRFWTARARSSHKEIES